MEQIKYTSLDRILSKIGRDLGTEDIQENDIVEWSGEALEAIGAVTLYEEAVAFIEVKNHQCDLPSGLHSIIQIARNNCFQGFKESLDESLCPKKIVQELSTNDDIHIQPCNCPQENPCSCNGPKVDYTLLDCEGKPITGYDIAYYRPYFDLQYEYYGWCNSSFYRSCYSPVRLSNNTFFNSLVCQENDTDIKNLYQTYHNTDEYTIIKGETLRFSFQEGSIALSYLRQVVDSETGYPMIPDHYSYITAITKYVTMKIMERDFYAGRDGSQARLMKAESDWQWYCGQAANLAMMPKGIDQHQNILEQRQYILPRMRNYYSFFGKMSRPESRKWNDPDNRNRFRGYYRGN
jgi:hypothetical protein